MPSRFRLFDLPFTVRERIYDFMIVDLLGGFEHRPYRFPTLVSPPASLDEPVEDKSCKAKVKARKSLQTRKQVTDLRHIHRLSVELLQHYYRWAEVKDGVPDQPVNWVHDGCDCCFDPIEERYKQHGYRPFGQMVDRFHFFQLDLEKDLFQEETDNGRYIERCGVVEGSAKSDLDPSDGFSFTACMFAVIVPQFARQPRTKQIRLRANMAPLIAGDDSLDPEDDDDFRRVANGLAALRALPNVAVQLYWGGPSSGHLPIRYNNGGPCTMAEFREVYDAMCTALQRVGLSWSDIDGAPDVERYDEEGKWPEEVVELALHFGNKPSEGLPFGGLFDKTVEQTDFTTTK